uniref:Uncharacterized protein n=1 Tax=Anguilla anguilla TaxID=7936 RepID=A0A0E9VIM8_ANGAN
MLRSSFLLTTSLIFRQIKIK